MMDYFRRLGQLVEQQWVARHHDELAFPEIALQALHEAPPEQQVSHVDVVKWIVRETTVRQDRNLEFGQPSIVVYSNDRFFIEVLFWIDGTTTIHQHGFSGAFCVLAGSSINSEYKFRLRERINSRFLIGDVEFKSAELLTVGERRPIFPGNALIHSVFHLDRPSVTVVIRTNSDPEANPQYEYFRPYFARDSSYRDHLTNKRAQALAALALTEDSSWIEVLSDAMRSLDFEATTVILSLQYRSLKLMGKLDGILDIVRLRHGGLADLLVPVLQESARQNFIIDMRRPVKDSHHRFFLALLLNVPDRDSILDLVARRYGGDPIDTIMRWMKDLFNTGSREAKSLLGLTFEDQTLLVFRCLLEGSSQAAIQDRLVTAGYGNYAEQTQDIRTLCAAIEEYPLFKSLVRLGGRSSTKVSL
jgi:hypothetical protein